MKKIILLLCLLIVGCSAEKFCTSKLDCNSTEYCHINTIPYIYALIGVGECREDKQTIIPLVEVDSVNGSDIHITYNPNLSHSFSPHFVKDDFYCYKVSPKTFETCECDILIYPDGHNESKNCNCFFTRGLDTTCINLTKENITIKKTTTVQTFDYSATNPFS